MFLVCFSSSHHKSYLSSSLVSVLKEVFIFIKTVNSIFILTMSTVNISALLVLPSVLWRLGHSHFLLLVVCCKIIYQSTLKNTWAFVSHQRRSTGLWLYPAFIDLYWTTPQSLQAFCLRSLLYPDPHASSSSLLFSVLQVRKSRETKSTQTAVPRFSNPWLIDYKLSHSSFLCDFLHHTADLPLFFYFCLISLSRIYFIS